MLTRRSVPAPMPIGVRIDALTDLMRSEDGLPSRVGIRHHDEGGKTRVRATPAAPQVSNG